MILSAGLTPAWQQIMRFDRFTPGEVNRAIEVHWLPSGKVVNVAAALVQLGGPSAIVATLGSPDLFEPELAKLGIRGKFVATVAPTRICTTIVDSAAQTVTELVENAGSVTAQEVAAFQKTFGELAADAEVVVLAGSLPNGAPPTLFRDLLAAVRGKAIVDARGPELLAALDKHPLLVKPNRAELELTLGRSCDTDLQLHDGMAELCRRGATWTLVTSGRREVWLMSANELHSFTPVDVPTVNPIGCGDCLAAGIAFALKRGDDLPAAVRFGLGAAADNARQILPAQINPQRVADLAAQVQWQKH